MSLAKKTITEALNISRLSAGGRINKAGLFELMPPNTPRLDYDPKTKIARGILIEEERTNRIRNSTGAGLGWTQTEGATAKVVVTPNSAIAPDGKMTATTIAFSDKPSGESALHKQQVTGLPANSMLSPSMWVRANTPTTIKIRQGDANLTLPLFQVTTEWQRIEAPSGVTVSTAFNFDIAPDTSAIASTARTIQIWGVQLEIGPFASSHIPTGDSTATRSIDHVSLKNLDGWFNPKYSSAFVEFNPGPTAGTRTTGFAFLGDNTGGAMIMLRKGASSVLEAVSRLSDGVTTVTVVTGAALPPSEPVRGSLRISSSGLSSCSNGSAIKSSPVTSVPVPTRLLIGSIGGSTWAANGHIRSVKYFPFELSDQMLKEITQW